MRSVTTLVRGRTSSPKRDIVRTRAVHRFVGLRLQSGFRPFPYNVFHCLDIGTEPARADRALDDSRRFFRYGIPVGATRTLMAGRRNLRPSSDRNLRRHLVAKPEPTLRFHGDARLCSRPLESWRRVALCKRSWTPNLPPQKKKTSESSPNVADSFAMIAKTSIFPDPGLVSRLDSHWRRRPRILPERIDLAIDIHVKYVAKSVKSRKSWTVTTRPRLSGVSRTVLRGEDEWIAPLPLGNFSLDTLRQRTFYLNC